MFRLKQAKNKRPSTGSQLKKPIKFPFPTLPKRKEIIEKIKQKLLQTAIEQLKKELTKPIEETIVLSLVVPIQTAVELSNSIPTPKPTKDQLKQFVKDTINGNTPKIQLPGVSIPPLPSKEELQKQIENKLPTEDELKSLANEIIRDKIPQIPNVFFIPPTYKFDFQSNIMINPFINLAKTHLMGCGGMISVISQYPPPAPPGPAVINWNGYNVPN